MKVTKTRLKQIIKEELETTMSEGFFDEFINKLKIDINPAEDQKAKKMMLRMAMRSKEKQLGLESGYLVDALYDMSSKERDVLSLVEEFNNLLEVLYTAAHRTAPEDQKSDKELGQMIKRFLENDPETVQLMYPQVNRLRKKLRL